jgi:hypothetical protein
MADDLASRSPETALREACAQRLKLITSIVANGFKPFPSAAEFSDRGMHSAAYAVAHASPKDRPFIEAMYRCPKGDVTGKPTVYTYNPPAGGNPRLGQVLLSCPFHPENRVVWDEGLQRRLDFNRKAVATR